MAESPNTALRALIEVEGTGPGSIAAFLDGLSQGPRLAAVRGLKARHQRALFALAEGAGQLTLEDLVPVSTPPLSPVRHHGMNSLPLFRVFEKRFYRYRENRVAGANFQTLSPLTGPGYFVVEEDRARGELLIDYRQLPDVAPDHWPPITANNHGRGRLVYGGMVDTLRRVSQHVTIGAAARNGKPLGSYFVLAREDREA